MPSSKKVFFVAILAIMGMAFFSDETIAVGGSGACSGHGGVSCSAGRDYDGSVICMDGWRGSSVSYSAVSDCRTEYIPRCFVPYATGCSNEESYLEKQASCTSLRAMDARSGLLNTPMSAVVQCEALLVQCREQINAYQARMREYNQCLYEIIYPPSTPQAPVIPVVQQPQQPVQEPSDAYRQYECERKLGTAAKYNTISGICGCSFGYVLNGSQSMCVYDDPAKKIIYMPITTPSVEPVLTKQIEVKVTPPIQIIAPLTLEKPKAAKIDYVTTPKRANIRASKSSKAKIIGVTSVKTNYPLLEEGNDWVKIQFGSKTGWVMKSLVIIE